MKLMGKTVYLDTLERQDCRALWQATEWDIDNLTEEPGLGLSVEKADEWFEEIQRLQRNRHIRLGIFLEDGRVIGDAALQNLDYRNRCCSVGIGIARLADRAKGYGGQALDLLLKYGFHCLGMERITANTLEVNAGSRRLLETHGFLLEGRERKAVYLNGQKYDRLCYGLLREEYEAGAK